MKRFTEAMKWRDPWFRELSVDGKLVFFYFLDNCDAAGVWEPDYAMANFCTKRDIDWDHVWNEFGDRIVKLPNGKLWMRKFIEFQYGPVLNPKNTAHVGVMRRLELSGIEYPPRKALSRSFEGPTEAPSEGAIQAPKDKDMDKDKGMDMFGEPVPDKPAKKEFPKTALQRRAERLFNRRESTVWDGRECRAWESAKAAIASTEEEDWKLLEWFYSLPPEGTYRRQDLATLLNNWGAEIDRARGHRIRCATTQGETTRLPSNVQRALDQKNGLA